MQIIPARRSKTHINFLHDLLDRRRLGFMNLTNPFFGEQEQEQAPQHLVLEQLFVLKKDRGKAKTMPNAVCSFLDLRKRLGRLREMELSGATKDIHTRALEDQAHT
jgi:hypothetical protein